MDIIELAREAGLQVLLDARIGTVTYHSVAGSLTALQRFADAVEAATRERPPRLHDVVGRRARLPHRIPCKVIGRRPRPARPHSNAASPRGRAT
ncbi:hypothetical protein DWV00_32680 [Trinickia dinghuensis]|uniref:Uncharacterized protein n=1 Tax=Trinickia dinghuensis TaxID=2291023 RepID=A0A3D8JNF0_9BURK|nr:hypothetical protein DWV00_32680 [Trinickia dinghuensis]